VLMKRKKFIKYRGMWEKGGRGGGCIVYLNLHIISAEYSLLTLRLFTDTSGMYDVGR
jgi:hypothetical protein